jgi:hypothetical protein
MDVTMQLASFSTEHVGLAATTFTFIRKLLGSDLSCATWYSEDFSYFPQSVQANSWRIAGHDRFLPHTFQFINCSTIRSYMV